MELTVGTVVARSYEILGPLGRGGMGELFIARNVRTERRVALKMLRPDIRQRQDAIERFRREARATGMVSSDHVTQVLDVEEDPVHGIAIAFELLEGESLLEFLRRTGTMTPETLGPVIRQILRGLIDAHSAGVIHRDLKPSNIFLERRGDGSTRVKILDFGISKLPRSMVKVTLTEPNQSLGSFMFMPPEQIQGAKDVDERADIYAMGTLVFQSLTGLLPFASTAIAELVRLKTGGRARSLRDASGRVFPDLLEAFVAKCLQADRAQRFQSAREMSVAWEQVIGPPVLTATAYPPSSGQRPPPSSPQQNLSQTVPFRPADLPFPKLQPPNANVQHQPRDDMAQTIALPASSARPHVGSYGPSPAAGLPATTLRPIVPEQALAASHNPYAQAYGAAQPHLPQAAPSNAYGAPPASSYGGPGHAQAPAPSTPHGYAPQQGYAPAGPYQGAGAAPPMGGMAHASAAHVPPQPFPSTSSAAGFPPGQQPAFSHQGGQVPDGMGFPAQGGATAEGQQPARGMASWGPMWLIALVVVLVVAAATVVAIVVVTAVTGH